MEEIRSNKEPQNEGDQEKQSQDSGETKIGETKPRKRHVVLEIIFLIIAFYIASSIIFFGLEDCTPYEYELLRGFLHNLGFYSWFLFPPFIFLIYFIRKLLDWRSYIAANFIWLIILLFIVPALLDARRTDWAGRCKLTLKAIAATELAYQEKNANNDYGTWVALNNTNPPLIPANYTKSNIIDCYSIAIFKVKPSTLDPKGNSNNDSTFTIIAIPRSTRNKLVTFAIGEDQIPKLWHGDSSRWDIDKYSLYDKSIWKPLR